MSRGICGSLEVSCGKIGLLWADPYIRVSDPSGAFPGWRGGCASRKNIHKIGSAGGTLNSHEGHEPAFGLPHRFLNRLKSFRRVTIVKSEAGFRWTFLGSVVFFLGTTSLP